MSKKSLGRGLGAILGEVAEAYENELQSEKAEESGRILDIPLDEIIPNPYQPRTHFDEAAIDELARSIETHGLLQPVVVIEHGDGYMLIAGERRVRASKRLGLGTIRAVVAEIDKSRFRELALIENIQREDLNPIELARSYKELIEEHGITQEELGKMLHKSRSHIANTLRLLQLSDYVGEKVAAGMLSQGHAKMLVGLDEREQRLACDTIIGQKLNVRETEKMVARLKQKERGAKEREGGLDAEGLDLLPYKKLIEESVPFRINVKKRKVEIAFENERELKEFLKRFAAAP